jgi:hypothetical protein
MKLDWEPLPDELKIVTPRLGMILDRWYNTPYIQQSMIPKVGVDCVRFTCSCLDDIYRISRCPTAQYPSDLALHDRKGAIAAMRFIMRRYLPNRRLKPGEPLQPFDLVSSGPIEGGPGHAQLVGITPQLWHIAGPGKRVTKTSLHNVAKGTKVFAIFRCTDRSKWIW